jgi:cell wall-associated NlpC family hydrolase
MTLHPLLFSALSRARQGIFHFGTVAAVGASVLVTPAFGTPVAGALAAGTPEAGTPVLGHRSPADTISPAPLPDAATFRALFGAAADSVVGPSDSAAFLVQIPQSVDLEEVIAFGKTLIGRPYRSGSKGPSGFDCSGLMHYIFGQHGILMPSSSRDYAHRGSPVPYGQWEVGDFVLFGGRGIGHVGLVVGIEPGAVYMLHSGTSPGVCVQNFLAMPYYKKRYVGARRLF